MSEAAESRVGAWIQHPTRAAVVILTLAMASVVTVAALGWPPLPDTQLAHQGAIRDVILEREAAAAAISGTQVVSDQLRTPAAIVLLIPSLLFPEDYLTWTAAVIGIFSIAGLVLASFQLSGRRGTVLAVAVPTSVAFTQGVVHGSLFVLLAALLAWAWLLVHEERDLAAGVLLGVVGAARLWPFLLVIPLMLARRWRGAMAAGVTFLALTAVGLALPGVSWQSTFQNARVSSERWIPAAHNGSMAGWLDVLGPWAAPVGFAVIIGIWLVGLRHIRTLGGRIAWSLPAGILASPLAWMTYLLALVPVVAVYGNRPATRSAWFLVYGLLLFGYTLLPNKLVTTFVAVTAGWVVAVEADDPFRDRLGDAGSPRI